MAFRLWKQGKTADYHMIDRQIGEQYRIAGVDAWLYTYEGPDGNPGSTDLTKPDYTTEKPSLTSLGNYILGETAYRNYSLEAIVLNVIYEVQEAIPEVKIPGLFFNYNTMELTIHYNSMIKWVGRKIVPGDVLELPNLRDTDLLDDPSVCINRFFVVEDGYRAASGYSATWLPHIYKLRVKPLTNSPEFSKLLYNGVNVAADGQVTDATTEVPSMYNVEMDIVNKILAQAESEVPYMHWDNEHLYDDLVDGSLLNQIPTVTELPATAEDGYIVYKKANPILYEKTSTGWVVVPTTVGTEFSYGTDDGSIFFKINQDETTGYTVYQYDSETSNWTEVIVPNSSTEYPPSNAFEYYYWYDIGGVYQYSTETGNWKVFESPLIDLPFSTKDIAGNRYNHDDLRPAIPPEMTSDNSGIAFPNNPIDGQFFYRIDTFPVVLWKYVAAESKWAQFKYGGRQPWSGANKQKTDFLNSDNRVSIHDVVKPNIK